MKTLKNTYRIGYQRPAIAFILVAGLLLPSLFGPTGASSDDALQIVDTPQITVNNYFDSAELPPAIFNWASNGLIQYRTNRPDRQCNDLYLVSPELEEHDKFTVLIPLQAHSDIGEPITPHAAASLPTLHEEMKNDLMRPRLESIVMLN